MKIAPFYAIFVIHNEEPWSKANKCTQLETDLISVIETVLISGFQSPFSHLYKVIQQRHVGLCFFLTVRQIPPLSAINSSQMERSLQYKLYYNKSHLVIFIRLFFFFFLNFLHLMFFLLEGALKKLSLLFRSYSLLFSEFCIPNASCFILPLR